MDKTKKIVEYLTENGRMSGRDIVDDLGIAEIDVDLAWQRGDIIEVPAMHGGSGPWYDVSKKSH